MFNRVFNLTKQFFYSFSKTELFVQAVFTGLIAGFFVITFNFCITKLFYIIQSFLLGFNIGLKMILLPVITTLGGLISGLLVFKLAPETKGSGIPYVKLSLSRLGKRIRLRSILVKFAAGVAAIGSGLSLGREGPSVQLGAGAGALVSKIFKTKAANIHNIIASGAAAAIGATFNAPVAGTIFAIEELTQKFSPTVLFAVLVSTVSAVSVSRFFCGENPAFAIPAINSIYQISVQSLIVFIVLGLFAGCLGVLFAKTIFVSQKIFDNISVPLWLKPSFAGLLIGIAGLFLPYVMGSGGNVIELLLQHKFSVTAISVIFIVKFFVTPICFSSGAAGGIFFPMLMLGAFLGYFTGAISNYIGIEINMVTISIVGMGAFLSSVARTPITAIVMVFELTGDYHHILPVMLSVAIADLVAEKLNHQPIYSTLIIKQSSPAKEKQILSELKAVDAMDTKIETVTIDQNLSDIIKIISQNKYDFVPVVDNKNKFVATITKDDLQDYFVQSTDISCPVETIMNSEPLYVKRDTDLFSALFVLHLNNINSITVVDADMKVVGIVARKQIMFEDKINNILTN